MKLSTLISARKVLLDHANDKTSPGLAYKFMKIVKASDNEDAFYAEKLNSIIDEYAQRGAEGQVMVERSSVVIDPKRIKDCEVAIRELQDTEVEKPAVNLLLKELEVMQISMAEIAALDEFIIEEE